jgi:hypothetical protein
MSDPRRLIDTESGRARSLLEGGQSERAPAHVRAKVSCSVSAIVAGLELGAADPSPSGAEAAIDDAEHWVGHEGTAQAGLSTGTPGGVLTKLLDAASSATAIKLSAVFAALSVSGVVYQEVQRRSTVPIVSPAVVEQQTALPRAAARAAPSAAGTTPSEGETGPSSPRAAERVAARVSAGPPASTAPNAARSPAPASRGAAARPSSEPSGAKDELAQQLALIARARARLRAGEPRRALELLDEYVRRFPRGTLEPEARALEQRARALIVKE